MMLLATPCSDLCIYVFISIIYGWILVFTCLYAWFHVLPCLCARFLRVYMYVSMPICLDLCFHMLMFLDLCSLHALCYLSCPCVLHAMFVCLDLGYVCHAMCYCSLFVALSFFLVFWPMVSTRSRPYGLCYRLYTKAHIKRVWIIPILHVYACLLLCFMLVLASVVLGFATFGTLSGFVVVWLHLMLMRPCLDVAIPYALP